MSKHGRLGRFIVIVLTAVLAFSFAACAAKSAFEFDEDTATQRAKEIVDVVNTKDYTAIYNLFADDAKKLMTVDGIAASFQPLLDTLGAFVEFKSTQAISSINKDGMKYINVYVKTKYENVTHVYNVAFDEDLGLQGFFTMS